MSDHLWEIANNVEDAVACVKDAMRRCGNFLTDAQTGEPIPWTEMGETCDRLGAALKILESATEPIKPAIEQERADNDHLADLADGASY